MNLQLLVVSALVMAISLGVGVCSAAPAPGPSIESLPADELMAPDRALAGEDSPSAEISSSAYWVGPNDAVVNGEFDFVQVLDLGTELEAGAMIFIDQPGHFPWQLQNVDPAAPNFIEIDSESARFDLRTVRRRATSLPPGAPLVIAVSIEEGKLAAGSAIDIRYSRLKMPSDSLPVNFPLYLQQGPESPVIGVDVRPLQPRPGPPNRIEVAAPSIVGPNQPFPLRLLVADRYGNPVAGGTPSLDVLVDGVFSRRIEPSERAALMVPDLILTEPGHHFIAVRSPGGGLTGTSNLILVTEDATRIDWIELPPAEVDGGDRDFARLDQFPRAFAPDPEPDPPTLRQGGRLTLIREDGWNLQVASADIPADFRRFDPRIPLFAEVLSGLAVHEWYGQLLASMGYRVSFVGSSAPRGRGIRGNGRTAVVSHGGEDWTQALVAGRTYVANEGSPIIFFSLNGAWPGSRIPDIGSREIRGEVHSEYALHSVELVRNGTVLDRRLAPALDTSVRRMAIRLTSSIAPHHYPFGLPRAGREWIGFVRATGAQISPADERHQFQQGEVGLHQVLNNPAEPGRVDFISYTQGGSRSVILDFVPVADDPTFELHIMAGVPDEASIGPAPETPAIRQIVNLSELQDESFVKVVETSGFRDEVEIELQDRAVVTTFPFLFSDRQNTRPGDYYYIRVRGLDGQVAWTSPVYVGGFDVGDE